MQSAVRRLNEIADSVSALIENSEVLARNNAMLLAEQADVINAFRGVNAPSQSLLETKSARLSIQTSLL